MHVDWTIPAWNIITVLISLLIIIRRIAIVEFKVNTMWIPFERRMSNLQQYDASINRNRNASSTD